MGPLPVVLPGLAASSALDSRLRTSWHWSDVAVHRAIQKMFPESWLAGVKLPVLEDLMNAPEFTFWRQCKLIQCSCTHDVLVDKAKRKKKQAIKEEKPKKKEAGIGCTKKLYKPICGVLLGNIGTEQCPVWPYQDYAHLSYVARSELVNEIASFLPSRDDVLAEVMQDEKYPCLSAIARRRELHSEMPNSATCTLDCLGSSTWAR